VSVVQNQTAVLTCAAAGDPYPEILWLRNGELLDPLSRSLIELSARGRQLKLYNTQVGVFKLCNHDTIEKKVC